MAKINSQKMTIELSQLVRNSEFTEELLSDEQLVELVQVIQEMVPGVLVEIEMD